MSFSNSSGGTLALPSPTHAHQIDVTSAVRTLRRSLSRSPSKFLSRTSSHSSDNTPSQPSPRTPSRRFGFSSQAQQQQTQRFFCQNPVRQQHYYNHDHPPQSAPPAAQRPVASSTPPHRQPLLTPLRASVKLSLRSAKSIKALSPASRQLARSRASPNSPIKRPLTTAPDAGNLLQSTTPTTSPIAHRSPLRRSQHSASGQENSLFSSRSSTLNGSSTKLSRHSLHLDVSGVSQTAFLKALDANDQSYMITTSGALKRNDATMNLDHPNQGSPVAKRRSMHGVAGNASPENLSIFGTNTTSSQSFDIHEDPASEYELFSSTSNMDQASLASPSPSAAVPKRSSSLRKSTLQQRYGDKGSFGRRNGERQLAQLAVEFSTPGKGRPRLSTDHFVPPQPPRDSPFSSGSPLPNPSIHMLDPKQHQPHPLSKSLVTSTSGGSLTEEEDTENVSLKFFDKPKAPAHPFSKSLPLNATRPTVRPTHDHTKAVATPNHSNRLWTAAFNSTGLISKVNRNPEDDDRKLAPPDTPCKKHTNPFATFPPPVASGLKRRNNNRGSFNGLSSTPFSPAPTRLPETFGNATKGLSIFQRGGNSLSGRRGSLLSLDGEDRKLFDDGQENVENVPVTDCDIPPTPTKNMLPNSLSNLSEQSLESPSTNRTFALPVSAVKPTPLADQSSEQAAGGYFSIPRPNLPPVATASIPTDGRRTPQTPHDGLLPLDTNRLSLSFHDGPNDAMPPPVTPTTHKDFRSSTSIFVTPVNVRTSDIDVDSSLCSKFDKVEQVGKGEFSTVYRVSKTVIQAPGGVSSLTASGSDSQLSSSGQVYAVKKSRHTYNGRKDREAKLREARILQALSHAEHVIHYIDDWEHNLHLYIQTEYCEEGTLEKFLGNVGRGGRLDDFRIYKILQDLCLGLKEIHDAGFMHLDMKPANILVTFEGDLKIADFGLAQPCVAAESVDVEGDREYMSPEMLKGQAGQSADIFSLGLITLEAAANVVLPDNGPTWVALRSGDLSEVPSLTWTPSNEVQRDAAGNPTETVHSGDFNDKAQSAGSLFVSHKGSELQQPPEFMVEAFHPSSLDSIVRWMTSQEPGDRPKADQILDLDGLVWIAEHRNAPATVFEGSWGPADVQEVSFSVDSDTEMTDI